MLTPPNPQLPLSLLTAAQGHPMLVELKDGETLNGHLVSCDTWMNLVLKEVVQTSPEGDKFFRLSEVYVRGNNVRLNSPGGEGGRSAPCTPADLVRTRAVPSDQVSPRPRRDHRHHQGAAAARAGQPRRAWRRRGQGGWRRKGRPRREGRPRGRVQRAGTGERELMRRWLALECQWAMLPVAR